jgi:hypothetical protein
MVVWIVLLMSTGIPAIASGDTIWGVVCVTIWTPFLVVTVLGFRNEVRLDSECMTARGWLRRHRWQRAAIEDVTVVRPRWAQNFEYLRLDVRAGPSHVLPGTTGSPWGPQARRRRIQQELLRRWIIDGPE